MGFSDNPVVSMTMNVWRFSEGNRKRVMLYFGMFIIANAISFLEPLLIGKIINTIQDQGVTHANASTLITWSLLYIVLWLGFWAFHGPGRVIEVKNAFLVRVNYMKYLLGGILSLPAEWHANHHSGDTYDKVEKASEAMYHYANETFHVIETVVRFVSSYIALIYFNLHASYIVLFITILALSIVLKGDAYLRKYYLRLLRIYNGVSEKVYDVITNITTVIILRIEKILSREIHRKMMGPYKLFSRTRTLEEFKWFLVSISSSTMIAGVLISYILQALYSSSTVMLGTVFVLYRYVERISDIFFTFAWKYNEIVRYKAAVENADEIAKHFKPQVNKKQLPLHSWKELDIKQLSFSYEGGKDGELHLKDIAFAIGRGEKIALIGESGSGKTTFLKLMRGLYDPKHIEIYLDNQHVADGFEPISQSIALIPQEPELFATSIKHNITVGVSHRTKLVKKYANLARFDDVADRLPRKYLSTVVEKGVNLSGGEKQRLALARGLLASMDKEIILLDEATSSVDGKNELAIYRNIFSEFKEKTIMAAVHRLHILPLFDRIVMFDKGKIVADGTYKQLLRTSKHFKRYWDKYHDVKE